MMPWKEVIYVDHVPRSIECILVGDIGGTNSNFGVFEQTKDGLRLLVSVHLKSKEITNFLETLRKVITYFQDNFQLTINRAGFAAAGVVSENKDYCKPTNLTFEIDARVIKKELKIPCVFIVNDFEIIGYGISRINQQSLVAVNKGKTRQKANKAIIGAGTGLGKCILYWNENKDRYIPLASEGGHADFAPQSQQELDLALFISEVENRKCNISWEDVLSGNGIRRIYSFFKSQGSAPDQIYVDSPDPDEIFNSRLTNEDSWKTFELYTILYARCVKNFALDTLALAGIYIAGGIAANNLPLFEQQCFMDEFINCGKQQELLKQVPVYVITDYNISLYGAVEYMFIENMC